MVYLLGIFGLFLSLIYPIILKPRALTPTNIPSLSVGALMKANTLFNDLGKAWTQYPSQPDLSNYTFGGKDPL